MRFDGASLQDTYSGLHKHVVNHAATAASGSGAAANAPPPPPAAAPAAPPRPTTMQANPVAEAADGGDNAALEMRNLPRQQLSSSPTERGRGDSSLL